jgi:hypothetical protein
MNPLEQAGEELVKQIQNEFDEKGLNDTGEARNSLSFAVDRETIIIEGLARVMFLQFGRRAGVAPPFSVIRDWAERKLNVPEEDLDSISWAIVKKIAREGTDILNDRAKGLQLEILIAELLEKFTNIYATFQAKKVVSGLIDEWKS